MNVNCIIARLRLEGPLHISKGREDFESSGEILHSDTLKSAIFAAGMQLFKNSPLMAGDFFTKFNISSAFPFLGDELFFPKPMALLPFHFLKKPYADEKEAENEEGGNDKKIKRLTYLGKSYFEKLLNANAFSQSDLLVSEDHLIESGKYLSDHEKIRNKSQQIIGRDLQQRVRVPKLWETQDPLTFYVDKLFFHPDGGLFFIVHGLSNPVDQKDLAAILRFLGDTGIGSNRNLGFGRFGFEGFEEISMEVPENASHWVTLSLYCPKKQELTTDILSKSNYSLIQRGGWISSPEDSRFLTFRKKSVYMFTEGSVFKFGPRPEGLLSMGNVVDLKPNNNPDPNGPNIEHKIWRDGTGIFFPMKLLES